MSAATESTVAAITRAYNPRMSAPAIDGTLTTAGGNVGRHVYGTIDITTSLTVIARVDCSVETGIGTGVYEVVQSVGVGLLIAGTTPCAFHFFVPTGRRYKFAKVGSGTAAFNPYNFEQH
jgi:hypothetical protein